MKKEEKKMKTDAETWEEYERRCKTDKKRWKKIKKRWKKMNRS